MECESTYSMQSQPKSQQTSEVEEKTLNFLGSFFQKLVVDSLNNFKRDFPSVQRSSPVFTLGDFSPHPTKVLF